MKSKERLCLLIPEFCLLTQTIVQSSLSRSRMELVKRRLNPAAASLLASQTLRYRLAQLKWPISLPSFRRKPESRKTLDARACLGPRSGIHRHDGVAAGHLFVCCCTKRICHCRSKRQTVPHLMVTPSGVIVQLNSSSPQEPAPLWLLQDWLLLCTSKRLWSTFSCGLFAYLYGDWSLDADDCSLVMVLDCLQRRQYLRPVMLVNLS
jgi:hypothetical protein